MKRTEIRAFIKAYLTENNVTTLSPKVAEALAEHLGEKLSNELLGNGYNIECEFEDFFTSGDFISGKIERCDSADTDSVLDSVSFKIYGDLRVMTWERDAFALTLNMDHLSEDDLTDIMHIDNSRQIDLYRTFMRISEKDRGKLSALIPNSLALELLGDDIPPYAFYQYDGLFHHTTHRGVGDLGGGLGYGGFVREKGTVAEIGNQVVTVGEHAFDGCLHLTEVYLSDNVQYIGKHAFSNIPGLLIYCNAPSKPDAWDDEWCDESCKVVFRG